MIVLTYFEEAFVREKRGSGDWLYLGKNTARVAALRKSWGAARQLDIAERLNDLAREIRGPFLDEVSRIGALQNDVLGWHSSSFAWKHPGVSDLFLLSCYRLLLEGLAASFPPNRSVTVLIEDPWFFLQCRRDLGSRGGFRCGSGRPSLRALRLRALGRMLLSRAAWLFRTSLNMFFQRVSSRGSAPGPDNVDCLLYSMPHPRCFMEGGGWWDPFLGDLDRQLMGEGRSVARLAPTGAWGFEKELSERSSSLFPLVRQAGGAVLLKGLFASWKSVGLGGFSIRGARLDLIAEREFWTDLGCARWCEFRFFYECLKDFFSTKRVGCLIYPFEQQPWEKMIVMARVGSATSLIGYQHSIAPEFFLPYFLGEGEARMAPLPDVVLTSGELSRRHLVEGGFPAAKVRSAGSLRYGALARQAPSRPRGASGGGPRRVLVIVAHDPAVAASLVDAVNAAFPDHGKSAGLSFFFRPHPTFQALKDRSADWMPVVEGDLSSQLDAFDVVVSTGTTVVFEARLKGLPVVVYVPETFIDVSALSCLIPEPWVRHVSARTLAPVVRESAAAGRAAVPPELIALREHLFGTLDLQAWRGALPEIHRLEPAGARP